MTTPGRTAIVDALKAVPGLEPTDTMPDVATAGAAWPTWVESTTSGKLKAATRHTYDVWVVLPAGYLPDTVDQADGLVDQLVKTLRYVGPFDWLAPATVVFDDHNSMPAIRVSRLAPAIC